MKLICSSRYTITYDPAADRVLPSPTHLHVRIKNTSSIALRAAYLHGPYALHVSAYPATFDPNSAFKTWRTHGAPQFEPNLKAGATFSAKLTVPHELRLTCASDIPLQRGHTGSVAWIIEITSQTLFSSSASTKFELLIGRDDKSLDHSLNVIYDRTRETGHPGQIADCQQGRRHRTTHSAKPTGVYSKAIALVIDDTDGLWNRPALPEWDVTNSAPASFPPPTGLNATERGPGETFQSPTRSRNEKKKKVHLVILTHGLHGNLGADMLYMKESIDATAKVARQSAKRRRKEARNQESGELKDTARQDQRAEQTASIAPLSGSQNDILDSHDESDASEDEEVIVRGFSGNVTKTEKGIQYLGKRLARYILNLTYPDQPVRFLKKKTFGEKLSTSMQGKHISHEEAKDSAHVDHQAYKQVRSHDALAYTFTSISFIGHSLGGVIQIYAMAYIQKHAPKFFDQIRPINFIAMAAPLLGLSNENPLYVRFALDFGLVGRTGQDLGLTWRAPTLAKSGWSAMVGGLAGPKEPQVNEASAKPLLRVLPTSPAHLVLRKFRNRTLYSNVVNDGIVPLRTSCLLFLDWRGLERVQKARRENSLVGTVLGWGWAEMMGQNTLAPGLLERDDGSQTGDKETIAPDRSHSQSDVPQPPDDAVDEDDDAASITRVESASLSPATPDRSKRPRLHSSPHEERGALETLWSYIRPSGKTTKNDLKMMKRSQTLSSVGDCQEESQEIAPSKSQFPVSDEVSPTQTDSPLRPRASQGPAMDYGNDYDDGNAPPKTTIFESAADLLSPPTPSTSWIVDPSSRPKTIFHDRVYHPEDIPHPRVAAPSRTTRVASNASISSSLSVASAKDEAHPGIMRVEEKIARAYHCDLSWRKVLVRLEPDAHNNMIVRRMFANAYGWPVVKHLCDTHFADTYAASTRDEHEPSLDRARALHKPSDDIPETVIGQESRKMPHVPDELMRQNRDELNALEQEESGALPGRLLRGQSSDQDDSYLSDTTEGEMTSDTRKILRVDTQSSNVRRDIPEGVGNITTGSKTMTQARGTADVGLHNQVNDIVTLPQPRIEPAHEQTAISIPERVAMRMDGT